MMDIHIYTVKIFIIYFIILVLTEEQQQRAFCQFDGELCESSW